MKFISLFFLTIISCSTSHRVPERTFINHFYIIGRFNGDFESMEIQTSGPTKSDNYEYLFDRGKNMMTRKINNKTDLLIYYDDNKRLDSIVDILNLPQRTTFFHKTKFNEHYAKYSKEKGIPIDYISHILDTANYCVKFIFNGKVSSIDSFDLNNNLVKKTLIDTKTFETYTYDTFGNVKNEYINIKMNNKDSLFNIITYSYEYDKNKNWTMRTLTKNYPNGNKFTLITKRRIKY